MKKRSNGYISCLIFFIHIYTRNTSIKKYACSTYLYIFIPIDVQHWWIYADIVDQNIIGAQNTKQILVPYHNVQFSNIAIAKLDFSLLLRAFNFAIARVAALNLFSLFWYRFCIALSIAIALPTISIPIIKAIAKCKGKRVAIAFKSETERQLYFW